MGNSWSTSVCAQWLSPSVHFTLLRMEEEQQPVRSVSSQKKAKLAEIKKKKRDRLLLPHQRDRKRKLSSYQNGDQMFKCDCHCCLKYEGNTSGISAGAITEPTSHSPSLEKLTLDLSNLTLNPCTPQPHLMQETPQKIESDNMHCKQNSKRMFQRLLHEWTE